MPAILFLTGASGSGKTSLVRHLRAAAPDGVYLHFDAIGVPDRATMVKEFGSGERWQAAMTHRWIQKIVTTHAASPLVILEGQARPSFIDDAFAAFGVARAAIALVHCDDEERERRLHARGQPELANDEMRSWSRFLLREAIARRLAVIDTTRATVEDAAALVVEISAGFVDP